jgi:photosystem II stability/assembly factor-like uncharacterized protein
MNIVYFYDRNLGFAGNTGLGKMYRTTNAGENWDSIKYEPLTDIKFINNLTGWRTDNQPDSSMQKTTDGGLTWKRQRQPHEGNPFIISRIKKFSVVNRDTIWGVGGEYYYGGSVVRALIYKTTNGGDTWGYQIPDTSFGIQGVFFHVNFTDKNHGWAFTPNKGVRTIKGGDSLTYFVGINQITSEIPNSFQLSQNYPNPFNPNTRINYELRNANYVSLKVYDIRGKEIAELVNQRQTTGTYQVDFNASEYNLSSGIYFYTLQTDKFKETKKMMLIK